MSSAEEEANKKRWEESGNSKGHVDEWRWTLNWDRITDGIVVGSCPRSAADIDTIATQSGCDAILCLQCDLCHDALSIDWPVLRERAVAHGIVMTRVAVRDFDHNDQALMLPEAVKMLYVLLSMGKKVYVHCTAGINRATLTVVGYLTFVKGMHLDGALSLVKTARPQAHPYVDCWRTVRARLLAGRQDEVRATARALASSRGSSIEESASSSDDRMDDWITAEETMIREQFQRQMEAVLSLTSSLQDIQVHSLQVHAGVMAAEAMALRQQRVDAVRAVGPSAMAVTGVRHGDTESTLPAGGEANAALDGCAVAMELAQEANGKVEELKAAMEGVARSAEAALLEVPEDNAPQDQQQHINGTNGANGHAVGALPHDEGAKGANL